MGGYWKKGVQEHQDWGFKKQADKVGYVGNPRWQTSPEFADKHQPCGYWWKDMPVWIDSIFRRIDVLTLNSGENGQSVPRSLLLDISKQFGYVLTYTSPSLIVKFSLSTFTRVGALTTTTNKLIAGCIAQIAGFLYAGDESTHNTYRYNLSTFAEAGSVNSGGTSTSNHSAVISIDETSVYLGMSQNSAFGGLFHVRTSDFATLAALGGSPRKCESLCITNNKTIYGGYDNWSGSIQVKKINGNDPMSLTASLSGFNALDTFLPDCAIDSTYAFAYFISNAGRLYKIRLSDFTLFDTLTLSFNTATSCVIDGIRNYLYISTNDNPAKIILVDLTTFSELQTITLNTGENNIVGAAIDIVDGFIYFSTNTSPVKIIKIGIQAQHFKQLTNVYPINPVWSLPA